MREGEKKCGITDKELLALVEGIRHHHVYLANHTFTVYTDHAALQYIKNAKNLTGRLARWSILLQSYNFTVAYKEGRKNQNADALSRIEHKPETGGTAEEELCFEKIFNVPQ